MREIYRLRSAVRLACWYLHRLVLVLAPVIMTGTVHRPMELAHAAPRLLTSRWAVGPMSTAAAGMNVQRTSQPKAILWTRGQHSALNGLRSTVVVARVADLDPWVARVVQIVDNLGRRA